MTIDGLKQWLDARPFKPFVMRLTNGQRVVVRHPELLARSESGRAIVVFTTGDVFEMIDLLHVASIAHANGERGRRDANGRKRKA